jgi:hypothetical protein
MATWYTDNLNGNDTTGLGTIAAPYKTINKAMTVGTAGDIVNVAGSGYTALSGTLTFTKGSANVTTSVDLTGQLTAGNVITITDPTFGSGIWLWKVFSVTATTIVLSGAAQVGNITVSASKLTNIHYYTTTALTTFETIPAKSDFEIQGGWTNNFTAQNGITAMVYQGASAGAASGNGLSTAQPNMYVNRFAFVNLSNGVGGSIYQWYPGNLWQSFVTNPSGANPRPHPTYSSPNLYLTNTVISIQNTPLQTNNKPGYQTDAIYYTSTGTTTPSGAGSIQCNTLYAKSTGVTLGNTNGIIIPCLNMIIGKLTIDFCAPNGTDECVVLVLNSQASSLLIKDMEYVGINTTGNKLFVRGKFYNYAVGGCQISLPSPKIIDDFKLIGIGNDNGFYNYSGIPIPVKDTEGNKLLLGSGQIIFADPTVYDTGTNSLRITRQPVGVTPTSQVPIKDFDATGASQTITFRAKASANATISFGLLANPAFAQANATTALNNTQNFALTTAWQTFTYTGLQAAAVYNLYAGTKTAFAISNLPSAWGSAQYVWIDSVTVS